jgi:hypothetical protein
VTWKIGALCLKISDGMSYGQEDSALRGSRKGRVRTGNSVGMKAVCHPPVFLSFTIVPSLKTLQ